MQTSIHSKYLNTAEGQQANSILRNCVHCGFCTATCPTYQLLGDELDGPRGRIYLIKLLLEGQQVTDKTQLHLDRCLSCRSCETTCPSGVRYSRLLDIGRAIIEKQVKRPFSEKIMRWSLRQILLRKKLFALLLRTGQTISPLLPAVLKRKIPPRRQAGDWPETSQSGRTMLILEGCVQPATSPNTNAASARVLGKLGITLIRPPMAGCCGALSYHLSAQAEGLAAMKHNIDVWWPYIDGTNKNNAEAIIMTASGCGTMVKEYAELFVNDPAYAEKAKRISALCKDISEILINEDLAKLPGNDPRQSQRVAFHSPCTLQHAQKINGTVEDILIQVGYQLTEVADSHLCCGSSGTYSILQSKLAQQLLANKLTALEKHAPDIIATANIGCQLHLESRSRVPVKHWIELLDNI